jgi:hypothetical protein
MAQILANPAATKRAIGSTDTMASHARKSPVLIRNPSDSVDSPARYVARTDGVVQAST